MDLKKYKRLYFIGIYGSGMEPLARLAAGMGYKVVGSDSRATAHAGDKLPFTVVSQDGHGPAADDLIVYSTAIRPANPDLHAAVSQNLPRCHRFELLTALFAGRPQVAVSGTHGKTTTTTMTAEVFDGCGLNPGYFAGGRSVYFGGGSRPPADDAVCVYEADESDGSFLKSPAKVRIITNIDADHLDYYKSFERLQEAFVDFARDAVLICCGDDPGVRRLLPQLQESAGVVLTYGQEDGADILLASEDDGYCVSWSDEAAHKIGEYTGTAPSTGQVQLDLPYRGRHYYLNAAAAFTAGLLFRLDPVQLAARLSGYRGVERRLQPLGILEIAGREFAAYDDYGHHPTEISAVLGDLSAGGRRVAVLFQPHRYTRTAELKRELAAELSKAQCVFVLPVYSAGEDPEQGEDHRSLAAEFPPGGTQPYVFGNEDIRAGWVIIEDQLSRILSSDEQWCFLSLGAGDVYRWPQFQLRAQQEVG